MRASVGIAKGLVGGRCPSQNAAARRLVACRSAGVSGDASGCVCTEGKPGFYRHHSDFGPGYGQFAARSLFWIGRNAPQETVWSLRAAPKDGRIEERTATFRSSLRQRGCGTLDPGCSGQKKTAQGGGRGLRY